MTQEHKTLKQRFLNGEDLSHQEVLRLCQFEKSRWPLHLWMEEMDLSKGATA